MGKSSVLTRFADEIFVESYLSTLGVDFKFRSLKIQDKDVKLQIVIISKAFSGTRPDRRDSGR